MARTRLTVLGDLPVEQFLRNFWQKKPVVIRGAFPDFRDPLPADDLAGLACESGVDSRLVMERGGTHAWQVTRGPFTPGTLRKLPRSHWTLLVESVDRHSDEIGLLASAFSFLPKWRIDDVMVSLAPIGGTVGAHVDSYDVFLIQGAGRRRWQVDGRAQPEYCPGLDLRILKKFRVEDEWILDPGDMLYVPPGVGHRGVTVPGNAPIAITYSVGFRAPSAADLVAAIGARMTRSAAPSLFSDRGRRRASDPGEISLRDIRSLRRFLIREMATRNKDEWALAVGEAVTSGSFARPGATRPSAREVAKRLVRGDLFHPAPEARMSWCRLSSRRVALFVNGESRVLPPGDAFAASILCGRSSPSGARRLGARPALAALAAGLLRHHVLRWQH